MELKILGSGAGGGFPQWNCNCNNCNDVRKRSTNTQKRTQSSIIVSDNSEKWVLLNASPDILTQFYNTPCLHPKNKRESKVSGIILMDSQIDHTTGLLMLREGCPHDVYCTKEVHEELNTSFPLFKILSHWNGGLKHNKIVEETHFEVSLHKDISFYPIPLISNAPPYSKYRDKPRMGDNIGLIITNKKNRKKIFYAPGLGEITPKILEAFEQCDILLIDGTCWENEEMNQVTNNHRTSKQMGHLPLSGTDGLLSVLDNFPEKRKILIHINNTNPILNESSKERKILENKGIEVSYDGMSIKI